MEWIEPKVGRVYFSETGAEGWCPLCTRRFIGYIKNRPMQFVKLGYLNNGIWGEFICNECAKSYI